MTARALVCAFFLICAGRVFADTAEPEPANDEPAAVIELGGAASHDLSGGGSSFGGDVAVEFTPIEKWLEIEAGTTPLFRRHSTEWDTDILFKKPWDFTEKIEFMIGAGPEWIRTRQNGVTTNAAGVEAALDFMFWFSARHRFGLYLEPGFDYSFGAGHERSIGVTGGLLIAIPKRHALLTRR
jgi:hypothetical protein